MTFIQRVQSPTPNFFKKIRAIGLAIAAIGGSILAAPIVLPAKLLAIAGYLTVAGGVASAVSQATTTGAEAPKDQGDTA